MIDRRYGFDIENVKSINVSGIFKFEEEDEEKHYFRRITIYGDSCVNIDIYAKHERSLIAEIVNKKTDK